MTILDSNCKMDPVTRFKKMLDNTGQNSDGLLFERDHSVRDGGDGDWIHAAINAMIAIIPMFFSSYAINCYVVGSCHGLSWFSTSFTLLWASIFF
jgi:hypothetical protein